MAAGGQGNQQFQQSGVDSCAHQHQSSGKRNQPAGLQGKPRRDGKRYRYVATLDSRTSPICRSLDGREFKYGKGPTPPQHFNCRSTTVPIIDYSGLGISRPPQTELRRPNTAFGPSRARRGDTVPSNQTYGEWLDKQPKEVKADVLGASKVPYFNRLTEKVWRI